MAVDLSHPDAMYRLARFYEKGIGVSKNLLFSLELLKSSSNMGVGEASFRYALSVMRGRGTERNLQEGLKYLFEANQHDVVGSFVELGKLYLEGFLVEKKRRESLFVVQERGR